MAETLSYQPETTTETVSDNLTSEEQENLAVGENYRQIRSSYWLVNIKMHKN